MQSSEEKLRHFSEKVFEQAKQQYERILEQAQLTADNMMKEREYKCLADAYKNIQKQIGIIKARETKGIAAAKREMQVKLLDIRERMMDEVFESVAAKIEEFRASEGYGAFLMECIRNACAEVGAGEIFIDRSDEKYVENIKKEFPDCEVLFFEEDGAVGGCEVINHAHTRSKNNTIAAKLKQQRQKFIEDSGLFL